MFFDEDMKYYDPDAYYEGGINLGYNDESSSSSSSPADDESGEKYQGEFNTRGERHGKGRLETKTSNGVTIYEGEFHQGKPHGTGVFFAGTFEDGLPRSGIHTEPGQEEPVYEGEWSNGHFHGTGCLVLPNGKGHYLGDFQEGQYHGEGTLKYEGEPSYSYEGEFKKGKRHGQCHIMNSANTKKYVGEFQNDLRHGSGVNTATDGSHYSGEWRAGVYHGEGKLVCPQGNIYEGQWCDGKLQNPPPPLAANTGFKKSTFCPPGGVYTGERSKEGKRHGRGTYEHNGVTMAGLWENDELHGKGEVNADDPKMFISGTFSRGAMTGHFVYNGPQFQYEGEFSNFQKHGKGLITWVGVNSIYEGEFRNDKYHGQGVLTHDDDIFTGSFVEGNFVQGKAQIAPGHVYEGEWGKGGPHGRGDMKFSDGTTYKGLWRNGLQEGQGVTRLANGLTNSGTYKAGEMDPTTTFTGEVSVIPYTIAAFMIFLLCWYWYWFW